MPRVTLAYGGERPTRVYDYLRSRFDDIFEGVGAIEAEPFAVVQGGARWLVTAGIIEAPNRAVNGYQVIYRRTDQDTGAWHEAEIRNPQGKTIRQFGYGEEGGYCMHPEGGLSAVTDAQYSSMAHLIDLTSFSSELGGTAATELLDTMLAESDL